jgi:sterol desaturase/sphingolipid hydroxylase (fatty acid hydroxylase superfamily)
MFIDKYFILECFKVPSITMIACFFLEFISWNEEWNKKYKENINIRKKYFEAIYVNFSHEFILGPIFYAASLAYINQGSKPIHYAISTPLVILTQNIGYALAHSWTHKKENYWIHKYHHTFNSKTFVRPVVAHTVSTSEFIVSYVSPILLGIYLFKPDTNGIFISVSSISLLNLVIHTPQNGFDYVFKNKIVLPEFINSSLITNTKHFYHHEQNPNKHYSAPLLDLDDVLELTNNN